MYTQTLKEFCIKTPSAKIAVTKTPTELTLKEQLFISTEFLNIYPKVPLALRTYCVKNDVYEIPKCVCGKPVTYQKDYPANGFGLYCSPACSRSNKDSNKEYQKYLNDREWLYEQRITLGKSKEQIAKELGCSTVPITKRLEEFEIEQKQTGIKNTKIDIPNKKELEQLYFIDNLTLLDIGKQYNVSNVTVKKWFDHYGIEIISHSKTILNKVIPKSITTNNKKYGVDYVFECPEIKEKIKETFITKYGVHYHPIENTSNAEKEILDFCNSIKPFFRKKRIYGIELDGFNEQINFAFEYCGLYWPQESRKGKELHSK